MKRLSMIIAVIVIISLAMGLYRHQAHTPFEQFIHGVREQAASKGVSQKTLNRFLNHLKPPLKKHSQTMQQQTHQPIFKLSFHQYCRRVLSPQKIQQAKKAYRQHYPLLLKVSKQYQVQPQIIIALWGLESDFGQSSGHFKLIPTLVTLAYQKKRQAFWRKQLIDALLILDQGLIIPQELQSSWAGAMGQPQFIPATYLDYAVDFDHDGIKNIWSSLPDVFASIANFLHKNHWHGQQPWGMPVHLPAHFPSALIGKDKTHPIHLWQTMGITQLNRSPLPNIKGKTALIRPDADGPVFLVFPNFYVLMHWNRATFESLGVGLLADMLIK